MQKEPNIPASTTYSESCHAVGIGAERIALIAHDNRKDDLLEWAEPAEPSAGFAARHPAAYRHVIRSPYRQNLAPNSMPVFRWTASCQQLD